MRQFLLALLLLIARPALADVPTVITDIAPVQSLAALVMGDLGAPDLLLDPATDPHSFQMRPSQARALGRADLVIWMGPALTPWLGSTLRTLAPLANSRPLLEIDPLPLRIIGDTARFAPMPLFQTAPLTPETTDTEDGELDPHAWLDPANAARFLQVIADDLAALDPDNADSYAANAANAITRLAHQDAAIRQALKPLQDMTLVAYHDAYRYFLTRYDLPLVGSLTDAQSTAPVAARMRNLRTMLAEADTGCILTAPLSNPALIDALRPGDGFRIAQLDAIGTTLSPGPELYEALIRNLTEALSSCAKP